MGLLRTARKKAGPWMKRRKREAASFGRFCAEKNESGDEPEEKGGRLFRALLRGKKGARG